MLLVLAVATLPLGLIGLWLTGSAARSGETLLRSRLDGVLEADARAMELTRAAAFDARCLRDKLDQDPQLGFELMKRFAAVMLDRLNISRLQLLDMYGKQPK